MLRTSFLKIACLSAVAVITPQAIAAPTLDLRPGQTTVDFSGEFLSAARALNLTITPSGPGQLRIRNNRTQAIFPVTSGSVDTGILRLEAFHSGGLTITAGTTRVNLSQFIIENTTDGRLRLRGIVSAGDAIVGELSLFDLTLTDSVSTRPFNLVRSDIAFGGSVRLTGVRLALTSEAAAALNATFRVTAFGAGLNIGTASVDAFFDERQMN
jgi:hypothetical protein